MMIRTRPVVKRLAAVLGIGAAALGIGVSSASAAVAHDAARKCEWDATWQVTLSIFGSSYADVTYVPATSSLPAFCRRVDATVAQDGSNNVDMRDVSPGFTVRFDLF